MPAVAPQVQYRDEFIAGFERRQSKLRDTVTTDTMIKGLTATFLIATSNREAVTRGANGLIPASSDNLVQTPITLKEMHDLVQKTGFNIFTGQSDQRRIMQETGMAVINREMDNTIIASLQSATTVVTGTVMSKSVVNKATTKLWNGDIQNDGMVYGLLTPAAWADLSDIPQFASRDYVSTQPLENGAPTGPEMVRWMGVNWMMHTGLPGRGTNAAQCYIYHKGAIGHAVDTKGIQTAVGYQDEQDYSYARHSLYHGAAVLQLAGIVAITHDDTTNS